MSQLTDLDSISSLLSQIRVHGEQVVRSSDDAARKKLIEAAERLIVAARTPGENLYLLCSQVSEYYLSIVNDAHCSIAILQWGSRGSLRSGML